MRKSLFFAWIDGLFLMFHLILSPILPQKPLRMRYEPLFTNDKGNSPILAILLLIAIVVVLGAVLAISVMSFGSIIQSVGEISR